MLSATETLRFGFGHNWSKYLDTMSFKHEQNAEKSICEMLRVSTLKGKRFLDVGCGSGIFSLAARRLGATVHSFDYDEKAVYCAKQLREKYYPEDKLWTIERGDVLDQSYIRNLGKYDIVYSWGVLHHTGNMWDALQNVTLLIAENGIIFLSLYNDQGRQSSYWKVIKQGYNRLPSGCRWLVLVPVCTLIWGSIIIRDTFFSGNPAKTWLSYINCRGMSPWHDLVDWVGGYPFEVSKPHHIFDFFKKNNFKLERLITVGGKLGCNEFVFSR